MNRKDYWSNVNNVRSAGGRERGKERRKFSWKSIYYGLIHNRRKGARRGVDVINGFYDDQIERSSVNWCVYFLILNILDITNTLFLLGKGTFVEANPIMDFLIQIDPFVFVFIKITFISLGLIYMYAHRHFSIFSIIKVKQILQASCLVYTILIMYQIYLMVPVLVSPI